MLLLFEYREKIANATSEGKETRLGNVASGIYRFSETIGPN